MNGIAAKQRKILLVEDDPLVAFRQAALLRNNGYEVVQSESGEKAVTLCRDNSDIGFVLMDIELGDGMDGAETARHILRHRDVPISFLTAHKEKEYVDRISSVPNYGYILKSAGEYVLMHAIERGFAQFREKLDRDEKTVLLTMDDVTKLTEYEKLFHTITENIPEILTITDKRFHFTYISRSNEKITGYSEEEMKSLSLRDLLTPDSFARLTELLKTFSPEKESLFTLELEHVKKDGSTFWAEEIVTPLRNGSGEVYGFLTATRDITEQKRLREALKESEEKFRLLAENARDAIFRVLLSEDRFEYISPAVFRISGYAPDELKDVRQYIRELVHPDWKERAEKIWKAVRRGAVTNNIAYPLLHKSGEIRWVSQSNILVRGKDGSPPVVEGIVTDISDLKEKEAELENLLRKNRQLLTEINHRVSNNLCALEALAQVELSVGEKSKEDSIADIINRVKAIHLIHEKLYRADDFSRINLSDYIRDLAETISASMTGDEAQFRLNFEVDEINFSPKYNTPLGIITAELLTNTFKYAEFTDTCEIDLHIRRDGNTIRYVYRDSGTGLKGTTCGFSGLKGGTGTVLIRELVSGLAGEISLHTENGTEFRIHFPASGK